MYDVSIMSRSSVVFPKCRKYTIYKNGSTSSLPKTNFYRIKETTEETAPKFRKGIGRSRTPTLPDKQVKKASCLGEEGLLYVDTDDPHSLNAESCHYFSAGHSAVDDPHYRASRDPGVVDPEGPLHIRLELERPRDRA